MDKATTKERATEKGIRKQFTSETLIRERSPRGQSNRERPAMEGNIGGSSSGEGGSRKGSSREGRPKVGRTREVSSSGESDRKGSPRGRINTEVPTRAGSTGERSLTIMQRKFLQARGRAYQPDPNTAPDAFSKQRYFFYGTLTDAATLARVLRLPGPPELQPAHIIGYRTAYWGPYPALLDGPTGAIVEGKAYVVQTPLEEERLKAYETDRYESRSCLIRFQDGSQVLGYTFVWNADIAELEDATLAPSKTDGSRSRGSDRVS